MWAISPAVGGFQCCVFDGLSLIQSISESWPQVEKRYLIYNEAPPQSVHAHMIRRADHDLRRITCIQRLHMHHVP